MTRIPTTLNRCWLFVTLIMLPAFGMAINTIDLASDLNSDSNPDTISDTVNGALFSWNDPTGSSGSGLFDAFVRIQAHGNASTQQGYNSDGAPKFDEDSTSTFHHSVRIGDVPIVTDSNGDFFIEIFLDANEPSGGTQGYISLDQLQVYESTSPNLEVTDISTLGTLRYDLDGGPDGDSEVLLDATFNSGSGANDYFVYIPVWDEINPHSASFDVSRLDNYFTFYSFMGGKTDALGAANGNTNWAADSGFEEWAFSESTIRLHEIPEPSSFALLGAIFVGIFGFRYFRRRNVIPAA